MSRRALLVVDDHVEMARVLADQFGDHGYTVHIAASGEEAMRIFRKTAIDLVLTDLRMKEVDGFDVLEAVKGQDPDLPVLIMTAFGAIDSAISAIKKGAFHYLTKPFQLEERIYRLRCVEAWSMVIPWVGIPLSSVLKRAEPTSKATFVAFTTLNRPSEMPGLNQPVLDWPYTEGLRMDEAMHPLTILAVGLYGKTLMNQNGAPLRLVVPWKYGFKSIKSIVRIQFVDRMPKTAWNTATPNEYGFYSNVNPEVDHPRWSQKTERRIPGFFKNRPTLMFNGYGDQVASLYAGMDLRKFY